MAQQTVQQTRVAGPSRRLFTWSWKRALDHVGGADDDPVLVRISLGKPKWLSPMVAAQFPYIEALAPKGCFQIRDDDAFRRCYFERLEAIGVDRIVAEFQRLLEHSNGAPLVLLCYEAHPSQCHRGDFATWWAEKTGELISEYDDHPERVAQPAPADVPLF